MASHILNYKTYFFMTSLLVRVHDAPAHESPRVPSEDEIAVSRYPIIASPDSDKLVWRSLQKYAGAVELDFFKSFINYSSHHGRSVVSFKNLPPAISSCTMEMRRRTQKLAIVTSVATETCQKSDDCNSSTIPTESVT